MNHEQNVPGAEILKQKITPEQVKANIEEYTNKALNFIKEMSEKSDDPIDTEQKLLEAFNVGAARDLDFKKYYETIDAIFHL